MKPLIVANWKANKTISEANTWVIQAKDKLNSASKVQVVVCGSFVTLASLKNLLNDSNVKVGAQNVSHLGQGAFTGEVTAEMLEGLVEYCVVGHSERKKYFGETEEMIVKKVEFLVSKNIIPVLCVASVEQLEKYLAINQIIVEHAEKIIFVYEPPNAISGGEDYHPETPESAEDNCRQFKEKIGREAAVIYGGSVNPDNIASFIRQPNIHGALPGQASLDAETFINLVSLANEAVV